MNECACSMMVVSAVVSIIVTLSTLLSLAVVSVTGAFNPLLIIGAGLLSAVLAYFVAGGAYGAFCG